MNKFVWSLQLSTNPPHFDDHEILGWFATRAEAQDEFLRQVKLLPLGPNDNGIWDTHLTLVKHTEDVYVGDLNGYAEASTAEDDSFISDDNGIYTFHTNGEVYETTGELLASLEQTPLGWDYRTDQLIFRDALGNTVVGEEEADETDN